MSTIVNTPAAGENTGGSGFLIGVVLLVILVILFFVYAVPYMGRAGQSAAQGASQAAPQGGDAQINVPKDINVNVKQPGQ